MNNPNKTGRTPQDKINRHVNFALHNSARFRIPRPADITALHKIDQNLLPDALPILSHWLKNLRYLNSLSFSALLWGNGICQTCLAVDPFITPCTYNSLTSFRNNLLVRWPKFSGELTFPIEGSITAYIEHTTEYKQLRKELSLHCIAELENLLIPQYSFGNFPLEHRIKILRILKKLYRLPATNDSWSTGLCYTICNSFPFDELIKEIDLRLNYLNQHFKTWKHFSGITHEPIPKNGTYPRKQLRKNLCRHVIKSIETELKYVL